MTLNRHQRSLPYTLHMHGIAPHPLSQLFPIKVRTSKQHEGPSSNGRTGAPLLKYVCVVRDRAAPKGAHPRTRRWGEEALSFAPPPSPRVGGASSLCLGSHWALMTAKVKPNDLIDGEWRASREEITIWQLACLEKPLVLQWTYYSIVLVPFFKENLCLLGVCLLVNLQNGLQ